MRIHLVIALLLSAGLPLCAQNASNKKPHTAIKAVINHFFEGMEKGDTVLLKSTCTSTMVLQTYMADKTGQMRVITQPFAEFVKLVGSPSQNKFDERIRFKRIEAEQSLASVWTPYQFYLNDQLHHCGTNSFQLVNTPEGWKIQYIIDTRRKDCK